MNEDELIEIDYREQCADISKTNYELIQKIQRLEEANELMSKPCKCNPIGSGEEFCNGGCELREEIRILKKREHYILQWIGRKIHDKKLYLNLDNLLKSLGSEEQ